jgi:hypothetical protein
VAAATTAADPAVAATSAADVTAPIAVAASLLPAGLRLCGSQHV